MRHAVLGFILGIVSASSVALAAERADDWILHIDRESAYGAIHRRLAYQQHVDIVAADWPGLRGAAVQSQAALDGWMVNKGWGAWWNAFTAAQRADARQAILLGM